MLHWHGNVIQLCIILAFHGIAGAICMHINIESSARSMPWRPPMILNRLRLPKHPQPSGLLTIQTNGFLVDSLEIASKNKRRTHNRSAFCGFYGLGFWPGRLLRGLAGDHRALLFVWCRAVCESRSCHVSSTSLMAELLGVYYCTKKGSTQKLMNHSQAVVLVQ